MLILIVKLRAKPGQGEKLIELVERAIEPSRREEGCVTYEFLQDPFDKSSFTFYEKWNSREDLELHFEEQHFLEFAGESKEFLESDPILKAYEISSEYDL